MKFDEVKLRTHMERLRRMASRLLDENNELKAELDKLKQEIEDGWHNPLKTVIYGDKIDFTD